MSKVLVLTNSYDDAHIEAVAAHLILREHELIRVNVDKVLRGEQSITWDYQIGSMTMASKDQRTNLLQADSVWFRKPYGFGTNYGFVDFINDPVQRTMVEKEVRDIVDGVCSVLGSRRWVNHPVHMNQARLKPYQLHIARSLGMKVPDSIITSDPDEARAFCDQGPTIFKALASQELDYGDVVCSVDTTLMTDAHLRQLAFIRSQPILLQRCIEKAAELRVTVIGDEIFVARQTLLAETEHVDWRPLQGATTSRYEPWAVSPLVASQIRSLMRALNLRFGALDFAVDHHDQAWFLEVNPNGQWLGYTDEIGMPAAAAMAKLLGP